MVQQLARGIELIDGSRFRPIRAVVDTQPHEQGPATPHYQGAVTMWLTEGKKHEVRRVWKHFGFPVIRLIRQAYGPFELGRLRTGGVDEVPPRLVHELLEGRLPLEAPGHEEEAAAKRTSGRRGLMRGRTG
eukprot:2306393-Prymnesium_polylepis.1